MAEKAKAKKEDYKDVLSRARKRFAYVAEYDMDNRKAQREDTEFVYKPNASWSEKTRKAREAAGDPCMSFGQLKQYVNQVVNDQRQNRPGIRIHPASGDASEEVAETLQGLIRGIEYDSRAEAVYDCGYQHSVVGGRGYWRIVSKYESPSSFNQKLVIKRIPDPLAVYLDPDYQEPDGGDRNYGFVVEAIPVDEFEDHYPQAQKVNVEEVPEGWVEDDHIIVADYYERECVKRKLVALSDGNSFYEDELPKLPAGVTVVDEREVDTYVVAWYKIAGGDQVLEKHDWPGEIIPIVCTMGDEIILEGTRHFQGLTTHAKGAATLFDFGMTQQAISLSLTPRAPYVAAKAAIAGYEPLWNDANNSNYSVLPFNHLDEQGNPIPVPQRQQPSTPDSGWLNWTQQMSGLIKSTIGMYENSLGQRAGETSGRAILAREKQGDNSTFHFQDNLSRAIALTGRIIVGCIPTFYDTQRIVQIVGTDDTRDTVVINEETIDPAAPLEAIRRNDVTVGKYAVTVQAGPSYATKRQETAELLMGMVSAYPPLMQVAGDLVIKAQDVPDADVIAERLKLTLPPPILQAIQAKEQEKNGQKPVDPAVQAQMMQMQQQMEQMGQEMQMLAQENQQLKTGEQAKIQAAQVDAETKMQTAQMDAEIKTQAMAADTEAKLTQAQIDAQIEMQKAQLQAETALKKAELEAQTKIVIAQMSQPAEGEQEAPEADDKPMLAVMQALAESMQNLAAAHSAEKEAVTPDGRVIKVRSARPQA